jgi:hypothetical protein
MNSPTVKFIALNAKEQGEILKREKGREKKERIKERKK